MLFFLSFRLLLFLWGPARRRYKSGDFYVFRHQASNTESISSFTQDSSLLQSCNLTPPQVCHLDHRICWGRLINCRVLIYLFVESLSHVPVEITNHSSVHSVLILVFFYDSLSLLMRYCYPHNAIYAALFTLNKHWNHFYF